MLLSFASALSFVGSGKLPMTFNGSHMLAFAIDALGILYIHAAPTSTSLYSYLSSLLSLSSLNLRSSTDASVRQNVLFPPRTQARAHTIQKPTAASIQHAAQA